MSPEALIPMIGTACVALGAGLAKWGPDFFQLLKELVKGRTALSLRRYDGEAKEREATQKTFEELGTQKERVTWLKRELDRERELRERLERELDAERAARKKLEAHVERLERAVLEMLGPPAPQGPQASNVAELGRRRR